MKSRPVNGCVVYGHGWYIHIALISYTAQTRALRTHCGNFLLSFYCTSAVCMPRYQHENYCTPAIRLASAARASLFATASCRRCTRRQCNQTVFVRLRREVLADTVLSLVSATHNDGLAKLLYIIALYCPGTLKPPMLLCNGLPYPAFITSLPEQVQQRRRRFATYRTRHHTCAYKRRWRRFSSKGDALMRHEVPMRPSPYVVFVFVWRLCGQQCVRHDSTTPTVTSKAVCIALCGEPHLWRHVICRPDERRTAFKP